MEHDDWDIASECSGPICKLSRVLRAIGGLAFSDSYYEHVSEETELTRPPQLTELHSKTVCSLKAPSFHFETGCATDTGGLQFFL